MKTRVRYNPKEERYYPQVKVLFFWIRISGDYPYGTFDEKEAIQACKEFEQEHLEYLERKNRIPKVVWTNHEDKSLL